MCHSLWHFSPGVTSALLLDKVDDQDARDWYVAREVHHGGSRHVLQHQIVTQLRAGV